MADIHDFNDILIKLITWYLLIISVLNPPIISGFYHISISSNLRVTRSRLGFFQITLINIGVPVSTLIMLCAIQVLQCSELKSFIQFIFALILLHITQVSIQDCLTFALLFNKR